MRHLPLYLFPTAVAGYTLPVLASSEAVPDDAPAAVAAAMTIEVKMAITGCIDLAADRGHKVFIGSLASPELTAAVRASLISSGFELVDTHEQTDVVHELNGVFQALRPITQRTIEVRVGGYAENLAPLTAKNGRGGSVMPSLNPPTMLIGTTVSNVGDAADAQDSVNMATTGDLDGKCLSYCEVWRYRQRNVINLTHREDNMEQKRSVLATVEDAKLVPVQLVQSSLAGLREAASLVVALGFPADPALTK